MSHSTIARALLLALALLGPGAASAAADTVTVTVGPDPTEEVPFVVNASWASAVKRQHVSVTIKPAGSLSCAVNRGADEPVSDSVVSASTDDVAGTVSNTVARDAPGDYVLCAYLQSGHDATVPAAVSGPVSVTVRPARASISLAFPPRVDPGQPFPVSAAVTAEVFRYLFVEAMPDGGRGCGAAAVITTPALIARPVQGVQTVSDERPAPEAGGRYLLCGFVQEGGWDTAADAIATGTFSVGPDPCVAAKAALKQALKTLRLADAAVKRFRKLVKRKPKTYRASYKMAVRTRANARKPLAAARTGVRSAC